MTKMKNQIKIAVLSLLTVFSTSIYGNSVEPKITVNAVNQKFVNLSLENFDGNFTVYLKDFDGIVLYQCNFVQNKFSKLYDVSGLPKGDYYFEIEGSAKMRKIPFKINFDKTLVINESNTVYYKPVVRVNNNKLYITKPGVNSENILVKVFDSEAKILIEKELQSCENLDCAIDISNLKSGEYKIYLSINSKTFVHKIRK